jgi:hypothetical protein
VVPWLRHLRWITAFLGTKDWVATSSLPVLLLTCGTEIFDVVADYLGSGWRLKNYASAAGNLQ